jgi:hypothetical protein
MTDQDQEEEIEIDISFFPSNVFYKLQGIEFILKKHKLNPDPIMMPLYEKFAEEILDPIEAWKLKKLEATENKIEETNKYDLKEFK